MVAAQQPELAVVLLSDGRFDTVRQVEQQKEQRLFLSRQRRGDAATRERLVCRRQIQGGIQTVHIIAADGAPDAERVLNL